MRNLNSYELRQTQVDTDYRRHVYYCWLPVKPSDCAEDLHNVTYIARIDGVTIGSQATLITSGGQTNTTGLRWKTIFSPQSTNGLDRCSEIPIP